MRMSLIPILFLFAWLSLGENAFAAAPPPPQITSSSGHTVTGLAQGGATIVEIRTSESGSSCNANVQSNGTFTCTLQDSSGNPLQTGETIFATALNAANERSSVTELPSGTNVDQQGQDSRGFLRDGIFGCAAGTYGMPVGTLQAIGGVYVPVNDAAVTQNTGYLVYKECVLDGVVVRMREAASGAIVKSVITAAVRGGVNGNPQFVTNQQAADLQEATAERVEFLKNYNINNLCTPLRSGIKGALAREFVNSRKPSNSFSCGLTISDAEYNQIVKGNLGNNLDGFVNLIMNPENTPFGAYVLSLDAARTNEARRIEDLRTSLDRNNGFFDQREDVESPTDTGESRVTQKTLTPGYLISQNIVQAVGSGFRQLENANEIDQVINSLFSGLTNQISTDLRGLTGLTETRLGRAPYLDQLAAEASAGVRNAASNAALTILNSSIATEQAYNSAKKSTKSSLEQAVAQLKRAEERCWEILIPAVQEYARQQACTTTTDPGTGQPVQTCGPVPQLNISTSTQMITGGTIALAVPQGASLSGGGTYTLPVVASSVISQGSLQVVASQNQTFASSTNLGVSLTQVPAPRAGGAVTIPTTATSTFSSGSLSLTLAQNQTLPLGEVRFALTAVSPFTQAAVSLLVGVAQQFSDSVIASRITPALQTINTDITASNNGLIELAKLAQDIQNTASLTVQRIALERLDTLIAQRVIHTPYDVKDADQQQQATEASMNALVEDTVEEWGSGSGWCNAENPAVLQMWLDRWRVN